MKTKLLFTILATTMLIATTLTSAEIIPVWNKALEDNIQDMEIMSGGNEFMLTTTGGEIQIRDVLTGDTIRTFRDKSNLFMNGYFEFTPDSTRFVMAISGLLQLVNLQNFEQINYVALANDSIAKGFKDIVLDPIKPYAYVIITGWEKNSGNSDVRSKISVFNYETMELVKDLTEFGGFKYTSIAISDDGKYLATLNDGKAFLKVWNLGTMELIRNVQLYDDELPNDYWCESKDIQFSKRNSDIVYYSGYFTKAIDNKRKNGVFSYNIISESVSRVIENGLYDGGLILPFENENRFIVSRPFSIYILNVMNQKVEYYIKSSENIHAVNNLIYSSKDNSFIGSSNELFDKFRFDSESDINELTKVELVIFPNPTSRLVNINLNCAEVETSYKIININGEVIYQITLINSAGSIQVDFNPYPSGIYFLITECKGINKTYKIIKED